MRVRNVVSFKIYFVFNYELSYFLMKIDIVLSLIIFICRSTFRFKLLSQIILVSLGSVVVYRCYRFGVLHTNNPYCVS